MAASASSSSSAAAAAAAPPPLDFLSESNICGQTLLHLVSRGSAICAEISRLSAHIPAALRGDGEAASVAAAAKYGPVLFDLRYLATPEMFDRSGNTSAAAAEADY